MAMVCPQCKASFEQRLECPRCEVRLGFGKEASSSGSPVSSGSWQYSPWGRLAIGLLLAQGIYHGLRHLCAAGLLAMEIVDQNLLWSTLLGLVLLQVLQLVSLFIGALLAGAGQHRGALYGAMLGIWNGILVSMVQPDETLQASFVTIYGLPLLQAAVGSLAGWLGGLIWRPLTQVPSPRAARQVAKVARGPARKWFFGQVAWVKVLLGTAIAVSGTLCARVVLDTVTRVSDYKLSPGSTLEAQIVTWEITGLAILVGAAFAGASRNNGLMQGLAVGALTSVVLLGIRLADPLPPSFELLFAFMFAPLILGTLGGAFGSQLLPPLVVVRKRSSDSL